jgi:hypothetical protein
VLQAVCSPGRPDRCSEKRVRRKYISARLPPQRARGLSGKVRLSLDIGQVSLFDPMTEQRL